MTYSPLILSAASLIPGALYSNSALLYNGTGTFQPSYTSRRIHAIQLFSSPPTGSPGDLRRLFRFHFGPRPESDPRHHRHRRESRCRRENRRRENRGWHKRSLRSFRACHCGYRQNRRPLFRPRRQEGRARHRLLHRRSRQENRPRLQAPVSFGMVLSRSSDRTRWYFVVAGLAPPVLTHTVISNGAGRLLLPVSLPRNGRPVK